MKLRTRLTLLFTVITMLLTGIFGGFIYFSSEKDREKSFYNQLQNEAIAKCDLFFSSNLSEKEMHKLYRNNNRTLNEVQVALYDQDYNLIYHDDAKVDYVKETPAMLEKILAGQRLKISDNEFQIIGILYPHNGKTYAVTAAANDKYGKNSTNNLLVIILIAFTSSSALIYLAGLFFSRKVLQPVSDMVDEVKTITAGKLQTRLKLGTTNDELTKLAESFNQTLERLENSFDSQKHFVSNISHELRTPLAAMISEVDITLQHTRSIEDYQKTLRSILDDAKNMNKLSNSLMDLAKAGYDAKEISFALLRVDEVLMESYTKILKENPNYKISLHFDPNLEEKQLLYAGNEYLLNVAFNNLIDNACKYSDDKTCIIHLFPSKTNLVLEFKNQGKGIHEDDIQKIFDPFFRSSNTTHQSGHGIGLFLTHKIIKLHQASIQLSTDNTWTVFQVQLDPTLS